MSIRAFGRFGIALVLFVSFHNLAGVARAQGVIQADPRGPCDLYRSCVRGCYEEPTNSRHRYDRSLGIYVKAGPPRCNADAEILGWLLSNSPGIIVSAALPPVAAGGRAAWFLDKAVRFGVKGTVNKGLNLSFSSPTCRECMESCVDLLVRCHNQPVSDGSACGTFYPSVRVDHLDRNYHYTDADVTQTRLCNSTASLCCQNDSIIQARPNTAFCRRDPPASAVCARPSSTAALGDSRPHAFVSDKGETH